MRRGDVEHDFQNDVGVSRGTYTQELVKTARGAGVDAFIHSDLLASQRRLLLRKRCSIGGCIKLERKDGFRILGHSVQLRLSWRDRNQAGGW